MGLFKKNTKAISYEYKPDVTTKIETTIEQNRIMVHTALKGCDDIVYRDFRIGGPDGVEVFLFYVDGLVNKDLIDHFIITPLMISARTVEPRLQAIRDRLAEVVKVSGMTAGDFKENEVLEDAITAVLSGETAMLIDGYDKALLVATKGWPARGVSEPTTETVVRGAKEGFTETMRTNTALVRRRIRDPRFKVVQKQLGQRSKTDIAILYVDDIVDKAILDRLYQKLNEINIDAIIDSGYLEQFIEGNNYSPFPQVQTTERPDTVAAAVYEGRVGIIVDNSPFTLIVPTTMFAFFQSSEDYYSRTALSTFIRIVRAIAGTIAVLSPGLYIAITTYNPGIIPSKLALSIAATREGVPFPAFIEAVLMEFTFELLREAGVRLPKAIGATIGIVGGLVIGQAAVSANLVSPIMVIVVAITAIASFAVPNYEMSAAFRLIRFSLMIAAAIYGLYGIVLVSIVMIIHLANLKSFDVPYLAPVSPYHSSDMKDLIYRTPWRNMITRPQIYGPENKRRQGQ